MFELAQQLAGQRVVTEPFEVENLGISHSGSDDLRNDVLVFDSNGDGSSEILVASGNTYKLFGRGVSSPKQVESFITRYPNGDEKIIDIDYGALNDPEVHVANPLSSSEQPSFVSPMSVVKAVNIPTPDRTSGRVSYRYKNAQLSSSRGIFLGFEKLTKTSEHLSREEDVYFWGARLKDGFPAAGSTAYWISPRFPYVGKVRATEVRNTVTGAVTEKTVHDWSNHDIGFEGVDVPYIKNSFSRYFDLEGNEIGAELVSTALDAMGNPSEVKTSVGSSGQDPFECAYTRYTFTCSISEPEFTKTTKTQYAQEHPTFLEAKTA